MVEPGTQIVVSATQRLTFVRTGAETDGELLEVRARYRPHSPKPPAHYHPHQRERFEVLQGAFETVIDGEEAVYRPGDSFTVPEGTVHWMRNTASEPGELRWQTRPALRTAALLTAFWSLERERGGAEGGPSSSRPPSSSRSSTTSSGSPRPRSSLSGCCSASSPRSGGRSTTAAQMPSVSMTQVDCHARRAERGSVGAVPTVVR